MSIVCMCVCVLQRILCILYMYLCVYLYALCVYMRVIWAEGLIEIKLGTQYTTLFCVFV